MLADKAPISDPGSDSRVSGLISAVWDDCTAEDWPRFSVLGRPTGGCQLSPFVDLLMVESLGRCRVIHEGRGVARVARRIAGMIQILLSRYSLTD